MARPLIGISCCTKSFGHFAMPNHAASDTYIRAVDEVVGGVPVLLPASESACDAASLLEHVSGVILTGSRSNVQPCLYGGPAHCEGTPEDPARDAANIKLIHAAITAGVPLLAICRGLQELNVALGGTLHQRLQDVPGLLDHSTPMQELAALRHAKAHRVEVVAGTWLHRIARARSFAVNSLHNQGIDRLASGLVAEAVAPDGVIEAVRVVNAPAFAAGVQWHPEYDYATDAVSHGIFAAFADAVAARRAGARARVAAE